MVSVGTVHVQQLAPTSHAAARSRQGLAAAPRRPPGAGAAAPSAAGASGSASPEPSPAEGVHWRWVTPWRSIRAGIGLFQRPSARGWLASAQGGQGLAGSPARRPSPTPKSTRQATSSTPIACSSADPLRDSSRRCRTGRWSRSSGRTPARAEPRWSSALNAGEVLPGRQHLHQVERAWRGTGVSGPRTVSRTASTSRPHEGVEHQGDVALAGVTGRAPGAAVDGDLLRHLAQALAQQVGEQVGAQLARHAERLRAAGRRDPDGQLGLHRPRQDAHLDLARAARHAAPPRRATAAAPSRSARRMTSLRSA